MKIVSKRVLAGAAVVVAYACANPVDISGDVLLSDPSDFGDAGVFAGAGGGASAGSGGGVGSGAAGTSAGGTASTPSGGGSSGGTASGLAGTGSGTGGTFQVGQGGAPVLGGADRAGAGGGSVAGTGGAGSGLGGAGSGLGGTGGSGTGSAGTSVVAGTGGGGVSVEPVFDADACDFDDVSGCEDLTCEQVCPTNDGGSCRTRCEAIVTCVSTSAACVPSEADPLCAVRNNGAVNTCTSQADSGGGVNATEATQPTFIARQFVVCACTDPRQ